MGTAGRELEKKFTTSAACSAEWNRLIKEKIKKQYVETKKLPASAPKATSKFSPVNKQSFWQLVNTSLQYTNPGRQANYLKKELKGLTGKDLVAFENIVNRLENAIYTWNLWAAAYTIQGGCSDDGFTDFRGWLISRGESVYNKAMTSADSLSVLGRKKLEQSSSGECFLYLAGNVYDDLYGTDIGNDEYIKSYTVKTTPSGREWPEGSVKALEKLNPSLFSLFKNKWQ